VIRQGEVYWIDFGDPDESGPGYLRPAVVVQNNVFNVSSIRTVVVCALTSNLRRAGAPGNVLLAPGEANLTEQSVINVSQVFTVSKRDLTGKIGSLGRERMREVLSGITLLLEPRDTEE
jgi:mRNA interferase MazF